MGCSSTKSTPSSSYTYSDSDDDDEELNITEINTQPNGKPQPTTGEPHSINSSIENLITALIENEITRTSSGEQVPTENLKDASHDSPSQQSPTQDTSQITHPQERSQTRCLDIGEKEQVSNECSVADAQVTIHEDVQKVAHKVDDKSTHSIILSSDNEGDRKFSLRNILVKAELKKKHIYTALHHENDKATIHLCHSFRDTAPVSPVQSSENTLAVSESPSVSQDDSDWYKDDPIETTETDSNHASW